MDFSVPISGCIPSRTGGGRAEQKPYHSEFPGRQHNSSLSLWSFLCPAAHWGELRTRSCSPLLVSHRAVCDYVRAILIVPGKEEETRCQEGHHLGCQKPITCPTLQGCFPAQPAFTAANTCGVWMTKPGSATETVWMAPKWAPRAAKGSPQYTTQHCEKLARPSRLC